MAKIEELEGVTPKEVVMDIPGKAITNIKKHFCGRR